MPLRFSPRLKSSAAAIRELALRATLHYPQQGCERGWGRAVGQLHLKKHQQAFGSQHVLDELKVRRRIAVKSKPVFEILFYENYFKKDPLVIFNDNNVPTVFVNPFRAGGGSVLCQNVNELPDCSVIRNESDLKWRTFFETLLQSPNSLLSCDWPRCCQLSA